MSNKFLIDTDVLIDFGRGVEAAANRIESEEVQANLAISAITVMELLAGCQNSQEQRHLKGFLQPFEIIHLSEAISREAIRLIERYRLSHGLLMPDALIAATALQLNLALISKNQRDFRFIETLNLLPYP
jgi:predicted nucleic acid-binding protein